MASFTLGGGTSRPSKLLSGRSRSAENGCSSARARAMRKCFGFLLGFATTGQQQQQQHHN